MEKYGDIAIIHITGGGGLPLSLGYIVSWMTTDRGWGESPALFFEGGNAMTLKELIKTLKDYSTSSNTLKKEVRFCTLDCINLEFLSIYESEGCVFIDVGTEEDNYDPNACTVNYITEAL